MLDMKSTEKVYKHDLQIHEGFFECRTCGIAAREAEIITSQPCTRRGRSPIFPGKMELEPKVRLIEFTPDWPSKVHEMIGQRLDETWELIHQDGVKTRLVFSHGELSCERIPTTMDFPLMIAVVPKEQLMREQLEQLQLEEDMLAELVHLKELEEQESKKPDPHSSHEVASSVVGSSAMLPHYKHILFCLPMF